MANELIKAFKVNVVKLDKGVVKIEYLKSRWGAWIELDKTFKTIPKANEYVAKVFSTEC